MSNKSQLADWFSAQNSHTTSNVSELKRKFQSDDKENVNTDRNFNLKKEFTRSISDYQMQFFKKPKREPFKSIENTTQTEQVINHDTELLNLQCYSDPSYDAVLNNLIETAVDIPQPTETTAIPISDSFENLFTITREVRYEHVHVTPTTSLPVDQLNDSIEIKSDHKPKRAKKTKVNKNESKLIDSKEKKVEGLLIKKFPVHHPEAVEINYAIDLLNEIFTDDELKTGTFNFNKRLSKDCLPFDAYKTILFKDSIAKKFSYDEEKMGLVWTYLRPKLNTRLNDLRKSLKKST